MPALSRSNGRPRNPYVASNSFWQPGGTTGYGLLDDAALVVGPQLEKYPTAADAWTDLHAEVIKNVLSLLNAPVLRRVLEAILVVDHNLKPDQVTNALARLRSRSNEQERVYEIDYHFRTATGSGTPDHVYTIGRRATQGQLRQLQALYDERDAVLNKELLADAGQKYARRLLQKSGRFSSITQTDRLGRLTTKDGKNSLDILATDIGTGKRFGISVKNEREVLNSQNKAIKDIIKKGAAHSVSPCLMVPAAMSSAIKLCHSAGVRLAVLKARPVPALYDGRKSMRHTISQLRPVLGPEAFIYCSADFAICKTDEPILGLDYIVDLRNALEWL